MVIENVGEERVFGNHSYIVYKKTALCEFSNQKIIFGKNIHQ